MLSFKQYVTERKSDEDQYGCIGPGGMPMGLIEKTRDHGFAPDGTPIANLDWSDARDRVRRQRRKLQEKQSDIGSHIDDWTDHHDNDHIGGSVQSVHEHLADHDANGRGDAEAVRSYSGDSKYLNRGLYEHAAAGTTPPEEVGGHKLAPLDKALSKNRLKTDLNVFAGVRRNPGQLAKQHPDGHYHLPAYTSTTIDKDEARTFADHGSGGEGKDQHIIHFHLKAGQHGKYIDHHSANSGEREFLLPRGTTWKIHPKSDSYENNAGTRTHVWHAHPVEQV